MEKRSNGRLLETCWRRVECEYLYTGQGDRLAKPWPVRMVLIAEYTRTGLSFGWPNRWSIILVALVLGTLPWCPLAAMLPWIQRHSRKT